MIPYLRVASAAQFCSTVTPALASAASQAGIPSTISKPAVVLLATSTLAARVAERGLDVEKVRLGNLQHLCDNGHEGADIAGPVGKQHGVTVLEGKRHGGEEKSTAGSPRNYGPERNNQKTSYQAGCHQRPAAAEWLRYRCRRWQG